MVARSPKRSPSLIKWLVLTLALMNSAHGAVVKSKVFQEGPGELQRDDCPTHEDFMFPDSVRVQIEVIDTSPDHVRPQDVRNRSLSPWDYRINEDPNRFPYSISEAHCRYNACISTTGRGLNYSLNSVPIQQEVLVLRRKQAGCRQTYWLEKHMVTVGCTCAFSSTYTSTHLARVRRNYRELTRTNYGLKQ